MKHEKKSPITRKPLRHAGQSLDERINELLDEKAGPYITAGLLSVVMAGLEWWRYYVETPPAPGTLTVLASCICAFVFYKLRKILREVKLLKLGREGEREVGQLLDDLREKGYKVLHDIPGENFNLDHVIISKKGVYTIETKTYSKPKKGKAHLWYDGKEIKTSSGYAFDAPTIQATAVSKWLCETLKATTGKIFPVKPVVLFPGWFINHTAEARQAKVWVLNPNALVTILGKQQDAIVETDIGLIYQHISTHVRMHERLT